MSTLAIEACWKNKGIWGDRSCPELKQHTHCRNCSVFCAGASALLNRESPPGYREEWTERVAQPHFSKLTGTRSIVIFRVGDEWLALPTSVFLEVAELRPIHSLPHRDAETVKGLVNIRGELLVCISLASLLGFDIGEHPEPKHKQRAVHRRLLVIAHSSGRVVFSVDEVHVGCRYHPDELKPAPATVALATGTHAAYTVGVLPWEKHNVGVLDDELLFYTISRNLA
ncbi:MAG: chemotaxis protein CheW [Verrucomicrobiota bacterium]